MCPIFVVWGFRRGRFSGVVVCWGSESCCCWELLRRGWWCVGEVTCLLKERGERMRQQSSEGGDDGEGVSECVMGRVVRRSLGDFAGDEEKKR